MNAKAVKMDQCEVPYCMIKFIDNAEDVKEYFDTADAVIFQGGRMPDNPPKRSHPDQVYVFSSIESPIHLVFSTGRSSWNNMVNWTMTYRLDSDILYKYGNITPKAVVVENKSPPRNLSHIFRQKTKEVAWLVSDCVTQSQRERYVKLLKRHIKVDIYGRCGTLHNCTKEEGKNCLEKLAKEYKFYLSFENSICKDYITEKVFAWFKMDVINVVRGAITYKDILPVHTYIDTAKFGNVKDLAKYLKHLSSNEQEYVRYLKEKSKYRTHSMSTQFQSAYCELCKRLHNADQHRNVYPDIRQWWYKDMCQKKPKDIK